MKRKISLLQDNFRKLRKKVNDSRHSGIGTNGVLPTKMSDFQRIKFSQQVRKFKGFKAKTKVMTKQAFA
jgi:hypothetical protein